MIVNCTNCTQLQRQKCNLQYFAKEIFKIYTEVRCNDDRNIVESSI